MTKSDCCFLNTRVSQKFYKILEVYASLCCVYHMTETVQVMEGTGP